MNQGVKTILYPVVDLVREKSLFIKLLGVDPIVDEVYYVGFKVGDQDIGLVPNGAQQGLTTPVAFYHVSDIKTSLQELLDGGAQIQQPLRDVGGGKLTVTVKDPDNNLIGLIQMP